MKQPGTESIAKMVRLKELVERGELTPPIPGLILNCQKVFPFELTSPDDIQVIPTAQDLPPKILMKVKDGEEIILTAEKDFTIKVGRDAAGKPIFLTNLD